MAEDEKYQISECNMENKHEFWDINLSKKHMKKKLVKSIIENDIKYKKKTTRKNVNENMKESLEKDVENIVENRSECENVKNVNINESKPDLPENNSQKEVNENIRLNQTIKSTDSTPSENKIGNAKGKSENGKSEPRNGECEPENGKSDTGNCKSEHGKEKRDLRIGKCEPENGKCDQENGKDAPRNGKSELGNGKSGPGNGKSGSGCGKSEPRNGIEVSDRSVSQNNKGNIKVYISEEEIQKRREEIERLMNEVEHLIQALDFKIKTAEVDIIKLRHDELVVGTLNGYLDLTDSPHLEGIKTEMLDSMQSFIGNPEIGTLVEEAAETLCHLQAVLYLSQEEFMKSYKTLTTRSEDICDRLKCYLKEPISFSTIPQLYFEKVDGAGESTRCDVQGALLRSLALFPLQDPQLVLARDRIKNIPFVDLVQVCVMDKNSVLLVQIKQNHVIRINRWAELMSYQFSHGEGIMGAHLYKDYLYMAHKSGVTKIPMSYSPQDKHIYYDLSSQLPQGAVISKLTAWDRYSVILSDCKLGQIYHYNWKTNVLKTVISGMTKPSFLSVIMTPEGRKLVVSDELSHQVKIFNQDLFEETSMGFKGNENGAMNVPCATAVTPDNHILVADSNNHRVSLFTITGKFIRHILTDDHVKWPCGLAYIYPYLWLTEYSCIESYCQLKCFKIG